MAKPLHIKRAYDEPAAADGQRILVDRLWPRGLSKDKARIDHWAKEVAPSDALRHWFGHDPEKWDEFQRRYGEELRANGEAVAALRARIGDKAATLVYAAHDTDHNNAVVLRDLLAAKS
jgi:uncharacterized protein YeaO (DUF488 family)